MLGDPAPTLFDPGLLRLTPDLRRIGVDPDVEVYRSSAEATSDGQIVRTSPIALPQAACELVHGDASTYPSSASNLARTSLRRDNGFGDDGGISRLATVTGDAGSGFVANLTIGV